MLNNAINSQTNPISTVDSGHWEEIGAVMRPVVNDIKVQYHLSQKKIGTILIWSASKCPGCPSFKADLGSYKTWATGMFYRNKARYVAQIL